MQQAYHSRARRCGATAYRESSQPRVPGQHLLGLSAAVGGMGRMITVSLATGQKKSAKIAEKKLAQK